MLGPERARRWIRLMPGARRGRRDAAGDALPQPHRDGQPQPHHRRRGGGADRPLGDLDPGQRRLDALDRGDRSTTCAGSATRSRSTTAASPRSPSTSAPSPTTRASPRGAPVEYSGGRDPAAVPGRDDGHPARTAEAGRTCASGCPRCWRRRSGCAAEMGWPIMATPFSQLVGIQALLNVVQGERYATIPDENLMYLAGWYGTPPGEVDPEVLDRAAATARGKADDGRRPRAAARRWRRSAPSTARASPTRSCCCAT